MRWIAHCFCLWHEFSLLNYYLLFYWKIQVQEANTYNSHIFLLDLLKTKNRLSEDLIEIPTPEEPEGNFSLEQ